jgi:carbamate kinase
VNKIRIVVGLGGNALLRRGETPTADAQRANLRVAADAIAELAHQHHVIVTHGNGPQVGLLALQTAALTEVPPYPLDVLGAESEGMIGYMLEQELRSRLPDREIVTVLTQMEVADDDPAFADPSKPIGPVYPRDEAERLARTRGWRIAPEEGGWRRVVPSPEPLRVLELHAIELLESSGALVVCAGGGGVPVVISADGTVGGVEAVIDKDLAAALLAGALDADALLLLTDVDAVYRDWDGDRRSPIGATTPAELRRLTFAPGTMGPKVEAACRFVEQGGAMAGIGALADAVAIVAGAAGTRVT